MKKLVIAILAVCIVALIALSVIQLKDKPAADTAAAAVQTETAAAQTETTETVDAVAQAPEAEEDTAAASSSYIDYDKLYAAYDPDTVAVTINGHDVSWNEYYTWITYYTTNLEYYMNMYAQYGYTMGWADVINEETGATCADEAISTSLQFVEQIYNTEDYAQANGYIPADIDEKLAADTAEEIEYLVSNGALSEGATEEDFDTYLHDSHSDISQYKQVTRFGEIADEIYNNIYGENNENVSDEDALAYFAENGYVIANHILFTTTDQETGEAYDEAKVAEILAKAQEIIDELNAIEDPEERAERFVELKMEYDEDTGKTYYPNGYVFGAGQMVEEFYNASLALKEYEISAPVQSTYGYHIIMRMPDDADAVIMSDNVSAREMCGTAAFNDLMAEIMEANKAELKIDVNLLDYLQ